MQERLFAPLPAAAEAARRRAACPAEKQGLPALTDREGWRAWLVTATTAQPPALPSLAAVACWPPTLQLVVLAFVVDWLAAGAVALTPLTGRFVYTLLAVLPPSMHGPAGPVLRQLCLSCLRARAVAVARAGHNLAADPAALDAVAAASTLVNVLCRFYDLLDLWAPAASVSGDPLL
jgi:hypothetical protein